MKKDTYEVKEGKIVKRKVACPKCGEGVFMAEHKDRYHCGRCSYMRLKK